jgi:nuclear GTP-binding protein
LQITLTKRIYLIDCPGVVPPNPNDTAEQILLRGVVRVEAVENPAQYVEAALRLVQRKHLDRTYGITENYTTSDEFLEILARKRGKLHKGNQVDFDGVAITVLREFLRGKIPWYIAPPDWEKRDGTETETKIAGREGRLGEMAGKRKREDEDKAEELLQAAKKVARQNDENEDDEDDDEEDEFEGFEGTGVVLPSSLGDLTHFEENDEVDVEEEEEDNEEEASPALGVKEATTKVPPKKEDTRPPGKKRRKG